MIHIAHASERIATGAGTSTKYITYEGEETEIRALAANYPYNAYLPQEGRVASSEIRQKEGPVWTLSLAFEMDPGGLATATAPSTDWEKRNATLTTGRLPLPLATAAGYRVCWDHYLAGSSDAPAVPEWWDDLTSAADLDPTDAPMYRIMSDLGELPEGWHVLADPTKPGVETIDYMTYQVTEAARFRTAEKAGQYAAGRLNRIGYPDEKFGLSGEWKCDAAQVSWNGDAWIASLTWTRGEGDGWDHDLYQTVSSGS